MDSCVTAAIAASRFDVAALPSDYGQRTAARERQAFEAISDELGFEQRLVIDQRYMAAIGGSALTDRQISVPDFDPQTTGSKTIPATYVPFRNAHFLAAAISWARPGSGRGLDINRARRPAADATVAPCVCAPLRSRVRLTRRRIVLRPFGSLPATPKMLYPFPEPRS